MTNPMQDLHALGLNPFAVTLLAESMLKSAYVKHCGSKPLTFEFQVRRGDCEGWAGVRITIEAVPASGVSAAPRINPLCGVHGPIPCEGAGCICAPGVQACRWPDCGCHAPQGPGECRNAGAPACQCALCRGMTPAEVVAAAGVAAVAPVEDHIVRETVNAVTRVARECEGVLPEHLRARLADAMRPLIRAARGVKVVECTKPACDCADGYCAAWGAPGVGGNDGR